MEGNLGGEDITSIWHRFRGWKTTTKCLVVWTALILLFLALRLPFEQWSEQCQSIASGRIQPLSHKPFGSVAQICTSANAGGTLGYGVALWFAGLLVIGFFRYVPLPRAKR